MRNSLSLPLVFISSFIFFILIFALKYPVNHHAYIRVIEQNISMCESWECFRVGSFSHNMKGSLFVHYLFDMLNRWQGGVNALTPNLVTSAFFNSFFIMAIFFYLKEKVMSFKLRSLCFLGFFIASPMILRELFTIEDNITYYGFFVFYLFFQLNEKFGDIIDGAIGGLFLGLAIWMHLSPLIFLFTIALAPLALFFKDIKGKKILITVSSAVLTYYFFHIITHFDHFWHGSFSLAFSQVPLHEYLGRAFNLEMGAKAKELNYFSALRIGFEDMNWPEGIRYLGYLAWLNLIGFLILNFKDLTKNYLFVFICALALSPVIIYEPQFGERWDFFIISLFLLLISFYRSLNFRPLLVLFICFQAVNTGAMSISSSPISNPQSKIIVEFKNELEKMADNEYIILDKKFLRIDPYIISSFPRKERNIFFSDGERFYQTTFSLIARGVIPMEELWSHIHFDAWSSLEAISEPKGIQEVSIGCDIVHKENVYISDSLVESINKSCP